MFTLAKTVSLLVIFFLSFVSGVISCVAVLYLQRKYGTSGRFQRIKDLLTCFSGGVFFATSITTLMPEAREKMEEVFEIWDVDSEYPMSELLVGVGFLLILAFENISHLCCSAHQAKTAHNGSENCAHKDERHTYIPDTKVVYTKDNLAEADDAKNRAKVHLSGDAKHGTNNEKWSGMLYENSDTHNENEGTEMKQVIGEEINASKSNSDHTETNLHGSHVLNGELSSVAEAEQTDFKGTVSKADIRDQNLDPTKTKIRGLVLLIALSLHMVFDGLAIGLLEEDKKVWALLLALSIHKVLVFLSVGIETFELLKSLPKSVLLMFFFALVSPIGITIGVAVTESEDELAQSVASAVLQSVAAGTFIYVTFFEILQKEYEGGHPGMTKVMCTVVGFALIAGVKVLEGVDFGDNP